MEVVINIFFRDRSSNLDSEKLESFLRYDSSIFLENLFRLIVKLLESFVRWYEIRRD